MHMITNSLITAGVLVALSVASIRFDHYIDNLPPLEDQPDGETANQVVAGVLYTLVGGVVIVAIWFGWDIALRIGLILLASFMFAGWPMIRGDRQRQRNSRAVSEAKRAARDAQNQAKQALEECYDD